MLDRNFVARIHNSIRRCMLAQSSYANIMLLLFTVPKVTKTSINTQWYLSYNTSIKMLWTCVMVFTFMCFYLCPKCQNHQFDAQMFCKSTLFSFRNNWNYNVSILQDILKCGEFVSLKWSLWSKHFKQEYTQRCLLEVKWAQSTKQSLCHFGPFWSSFPFHAQ